MLKNFSGANLLFFYDFTILSLKKGARQISPFCLKENHFIGLSSPEVNLPRRFTRRRRAGRSVGFREICRTHPEKRVYNLPVAHFDQKTEKRLEIFVLFLLS